MNAQRENSAASQHTACPFKHHLTKAKRTMESTAGAEALQKPESLG
jgi:hypothetical protein